MRDERITDGTANRRTVLKGIGAGALGGVTGIGAAAGAPTGRVAGISYDTLTGKAGGPVSGTVDVDDGRLRGRLDVAGFSIPLGELERLEDDGSKARARYAATLSGRKFRAGDVPLKVTVRREDDHFAGLLGRPDAEYGHLGFFVDDEARIDPTTVLSTREARGRWAEGPHTFEVPETGLPTDSGLDRLKELARKPPAVGGDGR